MKDIEIRKEFKERFWKEYNKQCTSCKNKCKQSYLVDVYCPQFISKNKKTSQ